MKTKRPHIAGLSFALLFFALLVASAQAGTAVSKGGSSAVPSRTARPGVIAFDRRAHLSAVRPGGRGPHRIFLINADGSALRQLTSRGNAIQPAWSPNGREIAFSNGSPRREILIMRANGTKARVVARGSAPTFSPNGKRIAFGSPRTFAIWSVGTDGSQTRKLLSNAEYPDWSPDGKQIAFVARDTNGLDIYVASSTGDGLRTQLTQDGGAFYPAWAPNGKQVAFIDSGEAGWELRVLDVSGGPTRLLASNVSGNAKPTWSRDGKRIAFVKYGPTHELLMTVSATGGGLRTVTRMIGDSYGVSWRRGNSAPNTYKFRLTVTGKGTVLVGTTRRLHCASTCQFTINAGTSTLVRLRALPATGWKFVSWTGCGLAIGRTCRVRLPRIRQVSVIFVPPGDRRYAIPVGRPAPIGRGWNLTIDSSLLNANSVILAVTDQSGHPVNQPPPAGAQDYMVNITATYVGGGSSSVFDNVLDWLHAQGSGHADYAYYSCGTPPTPNFENVADQVFSGQSVTGNVCFQVAIADVPYLRVHDGVTKDVWFKLR